MKRLFGVLALVGALFAGSTASADSTKAREILTAARQAAQNLRTLSYEASYLADGYLARSMPVMDAHVVLARPKAGATTQIRIDGTQTMPRANDTMPFRFASDGTNAAYADDYRRLFMLGPDADAMPQERVRLLPPFFLSADAFELELKAHELKYADTTKVDNVECHVIEVTYDASRQRVATIMLGVEDFLVRRIVWPRALKAQVAGGAAEIFVARKLMPNAEISAPMFQLARPDGYRIQPFVKPQAPAQGNGMLTAGSEAPDWTLPDGDGNNVSLKSLRGQVVIIDFWASWCGPCKMAMPHLQELHNKYKDKPVKVYSVNCRERGGDAAAKSFIQQKQFTYPQLYKGDAAANAYLVRGIPTMYVIGTDGKILHSERGFKPDLVAVLSSVIDKHLEKAATAKAGNKTPPSEAAAKAG